jgi:hypothetical protein
MSGFAPLAWFSSMPRWLSTAVEKADAGKARSALAWLDDGLADWDCGPQPHRAADVLAAQISSSSAGRLKRRADRLAVEHRRLAASIARHSQTADERRREERGAYEREEAGRERARQLAEIAAQVAIFLAIGSGEPASEATRDRLHEWSAALASSFQIGYDVFREIAPLSVSSVERVELDHLVAQVVNSIALENVAAVDDVAALRGATAACLGFAASADDLRVRELIGRVQRRSGTRIEMPHEAAVSTVLLDALEAADPPREERDFFRTASNGAFYVGVGEGLRRVVGP